MLVIQTLVWEGEVDCPELNASASSSSHKLNRNALMETNIGVFRYPWEKGRLAKIFTKDNFPKGPTLKLRPGGQNPVHLDLAVDQNGSVSARAVVKPSPQCTPVFMQIVRKAEDVSTSTDKLQKRRDALQGYWNLLSLSLCSSSIGLKVSVEATADTVNEVALNIWMQFSQ